MTTLINGQVHQESSSTAGGESHLCTLVSAVTLLCSSSVSSHHPLLTCKTVEPPLELLLPVTRQSSVAPDCQSSVPEVWCYLKLYAILLLTWYLGWLLKHSHR